ncbi:hypothetical protein ABVT39_001194 [Epinephelus coioides]
MISRRTDYSDNTVQGLLGRRRGMVLEQNNMRGHVINREVSQAAVDTRKRKLNVSSLKSTLCYDNVCDFFKYIFDMLYYDFFFVILDDVLYYDFFIMILDNMLYYDFFFVILDDVLYYDFFS